jgi:two-component system, OmpR family, sensor histidine kinase KdpD
VAAQAVGDTGSQPGGQRLLSPGQVGGNTAQARFRVMRSWPRTVLYPLACVALTTALMTLVLRYTALEFESIVYLIPVPICAIRLGFVSTIVGIFASAGVADFLFIPAFYSFVISDPKRIVEIALSLFVAPVASNLAARLKTELDTSHRREHEIQQLGSAGLGTDLSIRLPVVASIAPGLMSLSDAQSG